MLIGELSAVGAAFMWSWTSIAFAEASRRVSSLTVNITRMVIGSIFLFVTIMILGANLSLQSNQYLYLTISGLIGFVFGDGFLFKAFQNIGPRLGMLLMALVPPISAILGYLFLDEVLSVLAVTGIIVTLAGIMIVVVRRNAKIEGNFKISKLGVLYGALGALGQAVGMIFTKMAFNEGDINGFVASFIRLTSAVIILYPLVSLSRKFRNPFKSYKGNRTALAYTTIGSFTGPYLGVTFSLIAVANAYVGIAATLMSTTPIIMLPIVRYFYKEKLSWVSIFGAFIAVAGVSILLLE
jgi:drug/metabolite transporter (DMT)-like permease